VKRNEFLKHLHYQGCILKREGGNHSIYYNPSNKKVSSVPRHNDIREILAEKICKDLDIISLKKKS
jgi:mRNA interferase HicA